MAKSAPLAAVDASGLTPVQLFQAIAAEREAREAAFPNLTSKLAFVMGRIGRIAKNGKNKEQGYDFVRESDIVDKVTEELALVNVSLRFAPNVDKTQYIDFVSSRGTAGIEIRNEVRMIIENGDEPRERIVETFEGLARDYGDKALPKAYTSARKTSLLQTFVIATGDDPENAGAGDHGTQQRYQPGPSAQQAPPAHRQAPPPSNARKAAIQKVVDTANLVGIPLEDVTAYVETMFPGSTRDDLSTEQFLAIADRIRDDHPVPIPESEEAKIGTPAHRETVSPETKPDPEDAAFEQHRRNLLARLRAQIIQAGFEKQIDSLAEEAAEGRVHTFDELNLQEISAAEVLCAQYAEAVKDIKNADAGAEKPATDMKALEDLG